MASFTTATGVKMIADTVGTDQRGDIQENVRPDFIWFDDFETRKTLRSAVTIRRDEHGIPYIEADNDEDAWYALGFCQGQDRAFQIETLIRAGRGRLAEIAGKDALPMDRLSRRIGFRRIAEAQLPLLDADVRLQIEAYSRGATDTWWVDEAKDRALKRGENK